MDKSGLIVTLGFFDQIFISKEHLKEGSTFDSTENKWDWNYVDEDEPDSEPQSMPMWKNSEIKVQVLDLIFKENTKSPTAPEKKVKQEIKQESNPVTLSLADQVNSQHFVVLAQIQDDGLGLTTWWM